MSKQILRNLVVAAVVLALALMAAPMAPAHAARPTARSVSVKALAAEGGTVMTITGKNLTRVTAVYFGATKTTKITHRTKTRLTVRAPAHYPGTVKVTLRVGKKKYVTSLRVRFVITQTEPTAAEAEVLRLTNVQRAAGYTCTDTKTGKTSVMPPVPMLTWDARLAWAARLHSADMAVRNYFSHTSTGGSTFSQRITRSGYVWRTVGENIAAGYPTAESVVAGWMSSYGHCTNIMAASLTELGVGYAYNSASKYDHYWTQDFGTAR